MKSKNRLKLAFQVYICTDNYGDDLLLPGVKSIGDIVTDKVFQASLPLSEKVVVDPKTTPKTKTHVLNEVSKLEAKNVWAMGPIFKPVLPKKTLVLKLVISHPKLAFKLALSQKPMSISII